MKTTPPPVYIQHRRDSGHNWSAPIAIDDLAEAHERARHTMKYCSSEFEAGRLYEWRARRHEITRDTWDARAGE